MRRRNRYRSYNAWPEYVPVAQRRAQAQRETEKLRKRGEDLQPVEIEGRTIARSFWGKGWCAHLESFGDYSNRLPRGRTYVRNGSVCHLGIGRGKVEAIVSGSTLYRVRVEIAPLTRTKWDTLKRQCTGQYPGDKRTHCAHRSARGEDDCCSRQTTPGARTNTCRNFGQSYAPRFPPAGGLHPACAASPSPAEPGHGAAPPARTRARRCRSDIGFGGAWAVVGCRLSVVGCRLSVVGCRLSVVGYGVSGI